MRIKRTDVRRLDRADAMRIVHEVACWIVYEREHGAFQHVVYDKKGVFLGVWQVGALLSGACCIAAYIVVRVLGQRGIDATVCYVPGHFFARTACGMRLDPTWGQFEEETFRVDRRPPTKHEQWLSLRDMVSCPKNMHPPGCWPGHHLEAIERILRRMGIEAL